MDNIAMPTPALQAEPITHRVVRAVVWRSGSQIAAQLVMWTSTFWVLRLLDPADYGLYAMTSGVMVLLSMLNGSGFAGALISAESVTLRDIRQTFALLILMSGGVALAQVAVAPLVGAYFHQPLVGTMLRVQALVYLANPLVVVPGAILARAMDFRRQGSVNLIAAVVGALVALGGALGGLGVWTLVFAPLAHAWTRAVGMTVAARLLVWPSFRFAGARATIWFGGAMLVSDLLWLVQSQSDIFIGGRALDAHRLGVYTTALFLAQIVASKFIPPLNEVAFTAYAKLRGDRSAVVQAFAKSLRLIMLAALPLHIGLALTARPFVETVLGPKWEEAIPVVRLLALAMPFLTLQVLFAPAATALGHPRVRVIATAAGALIMPAAFLLTIHGGVEGFGWAWLLGMPPLTVITARAAMPVLGISAGAVVTAVRPALLCSSGMALAVAALDASLTPASPALNLAMLTAAGAAVYAGLAMVFARDAIVDLLSLVRMTSGRPSSRATTAAA
jgi:O-antigen/teichoic acid export membrane protein